MTDKDPMYARKDRKIVQLQIEGRYEEKAEMMRRLSELPTPPTVSEEEYRRMFHKVLDDYPTNEDHHH